MRSPWRRSGGSQKSLLDPGPGRSASGLSSGGGGGAFHHDTSQPSRGPHALQHGGTQSQPVNTSYGQLPPEQHEHIDADGDAGTIASAMGMSSGQPQHFGEAPEDEDEFDPELALHGYEQVEAGISRPNSSSREEQR